MISYNESIITKTVMRKSNGSTILRERNSAAERFLE